MPVQPTYPGVYIEELPSGVRTITGVATSITGLIGKALRGPTDQPVTITSFTDYERIFGGLHRDITLSYAVRDFFLNGGGQAVIVRLYKDPPTASDARSRFAVDGLKLVAKNPGVWGRDLRVTIDVEVDDEVRKRLGLTSTDAFFNLSIRSGSVLESFRNLTVTDTEGRIDRVLKAKSNLMEWDGAWPSSVPTMTDVTAAQTALKALNDARLANPPVQATIDAAEATYQTARLKLDDPVTAAEKKVTLAEKALSAALSATPQVPATITAAQAALSTAQTTVQTAIAARKGSDGASLDALSYKGSQSGKTGLYQLEKVDLFNLLCILPDARGGDVPDDVYQEALSYCVKRRAMLIVDPKAAWTTVSAAQTGAAGMGLTGDMARNAAIYFPRIKQADSQLGGQIDTFVPCGVIAGVMARTDSQRGVWKAPAGLDASLSGVAGLQLDMTDAENGLLNPLGINCLRTFPVHGRVVWGSRTMRGADAAADEYKYVPVRRLALFLEESLYRGTQWVVFEPNDEPLWAQIRLNLGAFMHNLFRQGAFQGTAPRDAYFVKCDKETTTQNDINLGIVNIVVGFAPLKPAEFVVIKLQQMAGQIAS